MSTIQFPDEEVENFVKFGLEHNPNLRFIVQLSRDDETTRVEIEWFDKHLKR